MNFVTVTKFSDGNKRWLNLDTKCKSIGLKSKLVVNKDLIGKHFYQALEEYKLESLLTDSITYIWKCLALTWMGGVLLSEVGSIINYHSIDRSNIENKKEKELFQWMLNYVLNQYEGTSCKMVDTEGKELSVTVDAFNDLMQKGG